LSCGVNLAGTNTVSGTVAGLPFLAVTAIGQSQVNAGWTMGAGIEGALGMPIASNMSAVRAKADITLRRQDFDF
jgi:hypothetical protein